MPDVLVQPLLAALLASVAAGPVGALALVRRDTYAAAAVSHGCFAGLGLARWLAVSCGLAWFTPTLGATLAAVAAALFLALSPAARPGRNDAALSAVWAVGMAAGLAFLAATPGYAGSLQDYLFGSILLVSRADLWTMLAFDLALLAALGGVAVGAHAQVGLVVVGCVELALLHGLLARHLSEEGVGARGQYKAHGGELLLLTVAVSVLAGLQRMLL